MNMLSQMIETLVERLWLPLLVVVVGWLAFHVACGFDPSFGETATAAIHGLLSQAAGAVTGGGAPGAEG